MVSEKGMMHPGYLYLWKSFVCVLAVHGICGAAMEGFRGSSSRSSSGGSEPDVSSSSGWQEEEETLGGGAVPSSTSDAKTTHSAVQGKGLFTSRKTVRLLMLCLCSEHPWDIRSKQWMREKKLMTLMSKGIRRSKYFTLSWYVRNTLRCTQILLLSLFFQNYKINYFFLY